MTFTLQLPASSVSQYVQKFFDRLIAKNPGENEFHQAVKEVVETLVPCLERHPEFVKQPDPGAHHRARPDLPVPRHLAGRQGRHPGEQGLPGGVQQRHRALQGRPALPPHRQPGHPEVPGLRADPQEQPHHRAHGRRQGRHRLRPQGQVRLRSDALLPGLHEGALQAHRPEHRRARRRHRRGRPGDRLPVRRIQEADPLLGRRAHRQGPGLGRLPDPSGGHRLRRHLLRRRDAQDPRRQPEGQESAPCRAPATWPSTRSQKVNQLGGKVITLSDSNGTILDKNGIEGREVGIPHGPQEQPPRPHPGIRRQVQVRVPTRACAPGS